MTARHKVVAFLIGVTIALLSLTGHMTAPDLHFAIGAAESLLSDNAFINRCGDLTEVGPLIGGCDAPYAAWPPLLPVTLAGLMVVFGDGFYTAHLLLTALMWGAVAMLIWQIPYQHTGSVWWAWGAVLVAIINPATMQTMRLAISEPLFMLLTALLFVLLPRINDSLWWLLLIAGVIAIATLQRFTGGLLLIPALWMLRGREWLPRAMLLSVAVWPVSLWFVRGWYLTGNIVGYRVDSPYSAQEVLQRVIYVSLQVAPVMIAITGGVLCAWLLLRSRWRIVRS